MLYPLKVLTPAGSYLYSYLVLGIVLGNLAETRSSLAHKEVRMARMMLVLGLVLSLAGCGGGGRTDGLAQAEEDALEARVVAAEAAEVAAEAAQAAAEADKVAAVADKNAAEAAEDMAVADKNAAEAAKDMAVAAEVAAELAKNAAEAAEDMAVAAQAVAVAAKDMAELAKDAAEAAKDMAVAAQAAAVADKDMAELAKDAADKAKVAADLALVSAKKAQELAEKDAQRQRKLAEDADTAAVAARDDAATARQELATARNELTAVRTQLANALQQAGTAVEAQERLAAEAEAARLQARQTEASVALTGLRAEQNPLPEPTVSPKYRAPASVSATGVTFTSPRGSSAGTWYATTLSNRGATHQDEMVVYSDVGGGVRTAINEAHDGFEPVSETSSLLVITIVNEVHKGLVRSSRFPRTASTIEIPRTEVSMPSDEPDPMMPDPKDRARFSGTFDGASGEFRCIGSGDNACTVQYTGENYLLEGGTWTFRTRETSIVTVPDGQYMYFGWWRRQTISDGMFAYGPFSGTNGPPLNDQGFRGLEGTAVYEGHAIGQYAIYAPLSPVSNHGSFKATARLTANFGDATENGNISGTITGFANPGWAVTLKEVDIGDSGTIPPGDVSWMIDGNTEDGGAWNSEFHADLKTYTDTYPDGVTGTFDATYNTVGRMIGAFGANKK